MSLQTVLITGANRGLGLGLTGAYLADGWRVIALSRTSSPELETLGNGRLETHFCDLTDDDQLEAVVGTLSGQEVDVLINNAGRMAKPSEGETRGVQGFGHFDRSLWHEVFDINLFTAISLTELLVENLSLSGHARIVTISSTLGSMAKNTSGGLYAYRASKAGVNAVTKSLAIDLADRGIIVIALHPGWVRTDMGGSGADIDVATSVSGMKSLIDGLTPEDSGRFYAWDGSEMPW